MNNIIYKNSKNKPGYYAFFDVDGTIIKGKPMISFLKYYYGYLYKNNRYIGWLKYLMFNLKSKAWLFIGGKRESINKIYYKSFKNMDVSLIEKLGEEWFQTHINHSSDNYIKKVIAEIDKHKNNDAEIVFVSGSFSACLRPLAKQLNVNYILSTTVSKIINIILL